MDRFTALIWSAEYSSLSIISPGWRGHARVEAGAELRGPVRGRAGGRGAGAGGDEGPALHVAATRTTSVRARRQHRIAGTPFVRGRGVAVTKCIIVNVWVFARGGGAWLGSSPGCFRRRCRGVVREDGPARARGGSAAPAPAPALAGGRGRGGGLLSCVPRIQVLSPRQYLVKS